MDKLVEKSKSPSPPTSQPEHHELSVCFWAATEDNLGAEWYVFNVSDNDFKYKQKKVARTKRHRIGEDVRSFIEQRYYIEDHHHYDDGIYGIRKLSPVSCRTRYQCQNCVSFGSTIYCLGRDIVSELDSWQCARSYQRLKEFHCMDFRNPSDSWKKVTPMIANRFDPQIVVLDGKLYAFSGFDSNGCEPWGEVYDPSTEEWESVPEPPSCISSCCLIALDSPNRIIVPPGSYTFSHLHLYDVAAKSWEVVINTDLKDLGICRSTRKPVVVGHTIYWSEGRQISAYNFDERIFFSGYIQGLQSDCSFLDDNNDPCLLHLGGNKFCLLWAETVCPSNSDSEDVLDMQLETKLSQSQLHCVKLRVSIGTKDEFRTYLSDTASSFSVDIESCQSYFIDHQIRFLDALVLDGKLGKEEQLDEESAMSREVVSVAAIQNAFHQYKPQLDDESAISSEEVNVAAIENEFHQYMPEGIPMAVLDEDQWTTHDGWGQQPAADPDVAQWGAAPPLPIPYLPTPPLDNM